MSKFRSGKLVLRFGCDYARYALDASPEIFIVFQHVILAYRVDTHPIHEFVGTGPLIDGEFACDGKSRLTHPVPTGELAKGLGTKKLNLSIEK